MDGLRQFVLHGNAPQAAAPQDIAKPQGIPHQIADYVNKLKFHDTPLINSLIVGL